MRLVTQHLCLEKDVGAHGNLFGGIMMAWLDEAAAIMAYRTGRSNRMVTCVTRELRFIQPVKVGDIVEIFGHLSHIGTTSLTLDLDVRSLDPETQTRREVCKTQMVFVNIDKWGNKAPLPIHNLDQTNDDEPETDTLTNLAQGDLPPPPTTPKG